MQVNEVVVNGVTELSLVNDTVSPEALAEGETAHDASGKQIIGVFAPYKPTLIINGDFRVNQRGEAEYAGSGYGIDYWTSNTGRVSKKKLSRKIETGGYKPDGVKLVCNTATWGWVFYQKLPWKKVERCAITANIKVKDLKGSSWRFVISAYDYSSVNIYEVSSPIVSAMTTATLSANIPPEAYRLNVGVYATEGSQLAAGDEIEISGINIVEGGVASYNYAEDEALELLKCQKKLIVLEQTMTFRASGVSNDWIDFSIPTPTTMEERAEGALIINPENLNVCSVSPLSRIDGFTFLIVNIGSNQIRLRATKTAHGMTDAVLSVTSGKKAFISTEE